MTTTESTPDDEDQGGRLRAFVVSVGDLLVLAAGSAMTLAAITILASWPWALLAAGLALVALGTVVL